MNKQQCDLVSNVIVKSTITKWRFEILKWIVNVHHKSVILRDRISSVQLFTPSNFSQSKIKRILFSTNFSKSIFGANME